MKDNKLLLGLATLVVAGLVVRLLRFTDVYGVNMMFFDEWAFFGPLFHHGSAWEAFDYQHGPHRMGVGALISNALMEMSGWNTRWNAFAVAITMIFSAGMGVALCIKAGCRAWLSMLFCAVVFLNLRQYEALVGAVNLSHGALPEAILLLICLCWWIRGAFLRAVCIGVLTWIMIFTGFGLFAGLVIPTVLLIEAWVEWRQGHRDSLPMHLMALLIIASGWSLFAWGYKFQPAVAGFHFPHERPWEYLPFMALMMGYMEGISGTGWLTIGSGLLLLLLIIAAGGCAFYRLLRSEGSRPVDKAVLTLTAFTGFFCINAAIGRICLGWDGALASRYLPLMLPGILGNFVMLNQLSVEVWWKDRLPLAFCLLIAPGLLIPTPQDWKCIRWYHDGKLSWRRVYLETRNERRANEISRFQIYPVEGVVAEKMQFLQRHHLNLFKE